MIPAAASRLLKNWLLPPGVTGLLQTLARHAQGPATRRQLRANRVLHGRHTGQRGFILCSGPSITTQDLKPLRGRHCIGVANFFVHPDYATINPRYHCIAPLHSPFTDADGIRWFQEMEAPLTGRELFLSRGEQALVESSGLLGKSTIHYLTFGTAWPEAAPRDLPLDDLLPSPQSVSIMALLVALDLGFSEICLVGADHTSVDFQNGQYSYSHFYTGQRGNALGELAAPRDLEPEFASYLALWRQYKIIRSIADQRGIRILNATRGGMLDLFPRVELDSLLT